MRKGFTLIELLVVVAVIATLVATPALAKGGRTGKDVVDRMTGDDEDPREVENEDSDSEEEGDADGDGDEAVDVIAQPTATTAKKSAGGTTLRVKPQPSKLNPCGVPVLRTQAERSGPASKWAKPVVEEALKRGQANGGLDGRRPGAKSSDREWRMPVDRQEFAVGQVASAKYAEKVADQKATSAATMAVSAHARERWAHGLGWVWLAIGFVLIVAIRGHFFPRVRLPRPVYYP